jgi:hypothetical protein
MVVPRHLSQRRIKLLPRKYNATSDGKVMTDYVVQFCISLSELTEAIKKALYVMFFVVIPLGSILC